MKYGRLTVVDESKYRKEYGTKGRRETYVTAICDCGVEKDYSLNSIKRGYTSSCGCHRKQVSTKHGLCYHKIYRVWQNMIQRCENPKSTYYADYGARGITICDEWRNNIKSFIDWSIANGWEEGLDIDRIDTNGNYSPDNCRFVTRSMNNRNRRGFGSSKFKGVCWDKSMNKWKAHVYINSKQKHLGYYEDELQAAKAYNDAIVKHFPNNHELLNIIVK